MSVTMKFRYSFGGWIAVIIVSCGFHWLPVAAASEQPPVLHLHWVGLSQIETDTNAANLIAVWRLPETKALIDQTLDKLSCWPGHDATNTACARLRPLFDDVMTSETQLYITGTDTNRPSTSGRPEFLLAVRLAADRAVFWKTNLAETLSILTGESPNPTPQGWTLQPTNSVQRIEFDRTGAWTLIGYGSQKSLEKSQFVQDLRGPAPKQWLELDVAPSGLAAVVGALELLPATVSPHPNFWPGVHLTVFGENGNVHTYATFDRDRPFHLDLPTWEIPTNLIHGSLTSFTAARGFGGWLETQPFWQKLQLSKTPDQYISWSQGMPFKTYLAAPLLDASNQLAQLAPRLMPKVNPWLATNAEGSLSWSAEFSGILWNNANLLSPFAISAGFNHRDYLLGGLYPPSTDALVPPPAQIIDSIHREPGLVYASFEQTGSHLEDDLFIGQLFRMMFHKPQLPFESAVMKWIKKMEGSLGVCATFVNLSGSNRLELNRVSTIGLNAPEIHLLADWLESPRFPQGLHTFLAPPDK
jgi:hypothetical protein